MKKKIAFLRSQLSLLKPFVAAWSLPTVRKGQDKIGELMATVHKNFVTSEEVKVGDINCAMLIPHDEISTGVILYLHGGGFTSGNLSYAKGFASALANKCGIRVFCVEYRLAPESIFPAALDDSMEAYGYLLSNGYDPSQIIVCGESAGGGLAYSLCHKLRDKGRTLPAGIITVSPWTDLTLGGDSYQKNRKIDPVMTYDRLKYFADCYAYGAVRDKKKLLPKQNPDAEDDIRVKSDPRMSPLFAEQDRMPPSIIFVGSDEIMLDDSVRLHGKLLEAGSKSELHITPDMWHGYLLYGLRDSEGDFDRIHKFIMQNIPTQKKLRWMSLDNAAKIFPAARRRNWSNVFRLSATFTEPVDRDIMQNALDVTVRRFPSIAVRVKTGVFWYYLEEIPTTPKIIDEKPYPLSRMPFDDIRKCAFRVLVFDKRIAVEFFHALTDGNGGLIFLKTLVAEYIYQRYGVKVPVGNGVLDRLQQPSEDEFEDSFIKYSGKVAASRADTDAFKLTGTRVEDGFRTNTTFVIDAADLSRLAKEKGITVTAYMAGMLINAVVRIQEARVPNIKRRKPIKVLIPVNLRKFFPSKTLRNFVLYAVPGIDPRYGQYTFDELCEIVNHQMKLQIHKNNFVAMMTTNVNSERNWMLRAVPLFIKNIVMKLIFDAVGERKSCFSFSNLGIVNMPEEFTRYVERLDFVLGVQSIAPYNTSALCYNGKIYFNVIRNISEPILESEMYNELRAHGIRHTVESNTRERRI